MTPHRPFIALALALAAAGPASAQDAPAPPASDSSPVSYYKQIRPIFQANCHGCHQPAKVKGEYVMTDFERLLAGGESGDKAILPGKPDESHLVTLITPVNGEVEMPAKGDPLTQTQIDLVRAWIAQGASDDTPANARQRYDASHPPAYTRAPIVSALDFSPDGTKLAVSGFHEVLLCHADGSGLIARLVGLSERIESVQFSPDGTRLAVTGGLPARMGEVQIWDVQTHALLLSVPVTFDTVYGVSWSPDGGLVAFGCADNTVRAIDAKTGEQVLYQAAPEDWVFDTVFSTNGTHLAAAGRDMTAKLIEVATQRFVDNITSITPGALKGGLAALDRHPSRDEILVGGADGVPQVYRLFRETPRVIGDNANLVRKFPPMTGRIFDVAYAPDGKTLAAVSSLDGRGYLHLYASDFDGTLSKELKEIFSKEISNRKAEEQQKIDAYQIEGIRLLANAPLETPLYALAFHPDGRSVAAAGGDGVVRLFDARDASLQKAFLPAPLPAEHQPALVALATQPAAVELKRKFDYNQLLVLGWTPSGERVDLTRKVAYALDQDIATVSSNGLLRPARNGTATLTLSLGGLATRLPVRIDGLETPFHPDFIRDVNPVISRLGCNAGTCHGSKDGRNGFKLSLRGYDPIYDVRAFSDDLAARRINLASPDDSLMLLKATAAVPHEGGQRTEPGSDYYQVLRDWIAEGCHLETNTPRVSRIALEPLNPVVQNIGEQQQVRVIAHYADGAQRDVTAEAFIESGDTEIARADAGGLVTTVRRGEAPILARYEGAYAATTVTVMGDRTGFAWQEPPANNHIDTLVAAKWKRMKILPSDLCTDAEFIRRIHLDLTGLPPSAEAVRAFLADDHDTRYKRDALVDSLIGSDSYVEHWANKWADLLQVNRKFLGAEGAASFRQWIRDQIQANTPYDRFVHAILTAKGSNKDHPPASYYKVLRHPTDIMENTTQLFLATRFNCNKCHDHPFERWTQDQYYQTAAYFARVSLKRDPQSGDKNIGGTAVEDARPLYEIIDDQDQGEVVHDRTGQVTPPQFPFPAAFQAPPDAGRRDLLANWITSPDNPYFTRSYVNRIWGYLTGRGLIEPLDDIRAGNPPSNPELLDWMTSTFIESGFDVRELIRAICKSRTYQLSINTHRWNEDDHVNYSHAQPRRLPAEVLYDAIYAAAGAVSKFPGVPDGTRAAALPDAGVGLEDGFLGTLGRPARESACECERSNDIQLGPIMSLVTGPTVDRAISDPANAISKLVAEQPDDRRVVQELYVRILNRSPSDAEIDQALGILKDVDSEHQQLLASLESYRRQLEPITAQKEEQRQTDLREAETELAAYREQIAPREADLDAKQAEAIAKAEQALKDYDTALPGNIAAWEGNTDQLSVWTSLPPGEVKGPDGTTFKVLEDRSILAADNNTRGVYSVTAETDLGLITGLKIETLPDEALPKKGPGRAEDGNFVLTEFSATAATRSGSGEPAKLELENAQATFSQGGYDVKTAIDGKAPADGNGWAIHPEMGRGQTAFFELKQPLEQEGGARLVLALNQNYQSGKHQIGRFRLSVTRSPKPLNFGVNEEIRAILEVAADQRSEPQLAALRDYYRSTDKDLRKLEQTLAEAKKPRPPDPQLVALEQKVERVKQPLPPDPQLTELERAAKLSTQQLETRRLTGAQDVAWALINNPAFLFNR